MRQKIELEMRKISVELDNIKKERIMHDFNSRSDLVENKAERYKVDLEK